MRWKVSIMHDLIRSDCALILVILIVSQLSGVLPAPRLLTPSPSGMRYNLDQARIFWAFIAHPLTGQDNLLYRVILNIQDAIYEK